MGYGVLLNILAPVLTTMVVVNDIASFGNF